MFTEEHLGPAGPLTKMVIQLAGFSVSTSIPATPLSSEILLIHASVRAKYRCHHIKQVSDPWVNSVTCSQPHSDRCIIVSIPFAYFSNGNIIVSGYKTYHLITANPLSMLQLRPACPYSIPPLIKTHKHPVHPALRFPDQPNSHLSDSYHSSPGRHNGLDCF